MSTNKQSFISKIQRVDDTQDSIVGLLRWVQARNGPDLPPDWIAKTWKDTLDKSPISKKLALVYVANDIIQTSRSKGIPEYVAAFGKVLSSALLKAYTGLLTNGGNSNIKAGEKMRRSVEIWKQRGIYSTNFLNPIIKSMDQVDKDIKTKSSTNKDSERLDKSRSKENTIGSILVDNPIIKQISNSLENIKRHELALPISLEDFNSEYMTCFPDGVTATMTQPAVILNLIDKLFRLADTGIQAEIRNVISARTNLIQSLENMLVKEKKMLVENKNAEVKLGVSEKLENMKITKSELELLLLDDLDEGNKNVDKSAALSRKDALVYVKSNFEGDEYDIPKYENSDDDDDSSDDNNEMKKNKRKEQENEEDSDGYEPELKRTRYEDDDDDEYGSKDDMNSKHDNEEDEGEDGSGGLEAFALLAQLKLIL